MPVGISTNDEALEGGSDDGHRAGEFGGDLRGPVALLIPGQKVSGEGKGQHELHENQPEPEVDFTWSAVGAVDDDLDQMYGQAGRPSICAM